MRATWWLPWLLVAIAAATAVGCYVWGANQQESAREADREREMLQLIDDGYLVEAAISEDMARKDAAAMFADNADLKRRLTELQAKGARVVTVETTTTGPVVVVSEPGVACVVAPGDRLRLDVDEATVQTRAGNLVLVGQASAWRVDPEALLVRGPLSGRVEYVPPPEPWRMPWWASFAAGAVADAAAQWALRKYVYPGAVRR